MMEAGLWRRRRRRAKHRRRRPRRVALGELGQWDSSVHAWLEDRAGGEQVLISIHDDATSRLLMARFVARDNGVENRRAIIEYLGRHGRPVAVYTDHAGHFGQWLSKKAKRTDTIISRALGELGVEVILAGSPQAKGRVERSFGTAQDRLVKEMRVAGIATLGGANRFLADCWVPFWNERFTVEPRDPADAHRPLPPGIDLEALFAETETRKVARDFTIRFRNRYWQIPELEAVDLEPGAEVVVECRLNGHLRFRLGNRYLVVEPLGRTPSPAVPHSRPPRSRRSRGRSRRNPDRTIPGANTSAPASGKPWPARNAAMREPWTGGMRAAVLPPPRRRSPRPTGRSETVPPAGVEPPSQPGRKEGQPTARGRTFLLWPNPGHFYFGLTGVRAGRPCYD